MKSPNKRKPVLTPTILTTLAAALLSLLVSFGIPLTAEQQDSINTVITIAAPIVVGAVVSRRVIDKKGVTERTENGVVLAGQANELPTDTEIRDLGQLEGSDARE